MITAEWKPIPELLEKLRPHQHILVVGCATCAAECAAGGANEVESLAPLLRMALAAEGHAVLVRTLTLERQCEAEFLEESAETVGRADAILSLACGIGAQAVAERFPDLAVYPGLNTTCLAVREEPGVWASRCAACGDCVLGETFGLCPVARCAKSLLNGPCGGTSKDGTCEVDAELECVWASIVERARKRGRLDDLSKVRSPKDWSFSGHGGPKRIKREDQRL